MGSARLMVAYGLVAVAVACGSGSKHPGNPNGGGGAPSGATGAVAGEWGDSGPGTGGVPAVEVPVDGVDVLTESGGPNPGSTNGSLAQGTFSNPVNVQVSGNLVYVADFDNSAIRLIDVGASTVSTQATTACRPFGLAMGAAGELFVETDCAPGTSGNPTPIDGTIWRLPTAGGAPVLVVQPQGRPRGLAYLPADAGHPQGRVAFSDMTNHVVQVLDLATNSVTLLAGLSGSAGFANGNGGEARFNKPYGLAVLDGDLIVCDNKNHMLRRVTLDGNVTTYGGKGIGGLVDGSLDSAYFNYPQDVAVDSQGNVFVDDTGNHRIRVIHNGEVRTLAGGDEQSFADGAGTTARFFAQEGLDVTPDGSTVYVADGNGGETGPYNRIRRIAVPALNW